MRISYPHPCPAKSGRIYIFHTKNKLGVYEPRLRACNMCIPIYFFPIARSGEWMLRNCYALFFPSPSPCKVRAFRRRIFYGLPNILVNPRLTKGCTVGKLLYPKVRLSRINYANYGRISDHRVKILWKSNNPVNIS